MGSFSDINNIIQKRLDKIEDSIRKRSFLTKLAESLRIQIVKRTKLGYGVSKSGAPQVKLKTLSEKYKKTRKKNKGKLDSSTKPSKSNLTFTGDMLKSIIYKISRGKIIFKAKNGINANKIKWNEDKGRRFLDLSKAELNSLRRLLKEKFRQILK
jgi:hypothetical protein